MSIDDLIEEQLVLDAQELVCLSVALTSIEQVIARNPESDAFLDSSIEWIGVRLKQRLIATAGVVRNYGFPDDDYVIAEEAKPLTRDRIVGQIQIGSDSRDLTLKEACNRILHAKKMEFSSGFPKTLSPKFDVTDAVWISGEMKGGAGKASAQWVAAVSVPKFAAGTFAVSAHRSF